MPKFISRAELLLILAAQRASLSWSRISAPNQAKWNSNSAKRRFVYAKRSFLSFDGGPNFDDLSETTEEEAISYCKTQHIARVRLQKRKTCMRPGSRKAFGPGETLTFFWATIPCVVVRRNDDFGSERAFRADETLVSEIDQNVLRSAKLKTMFFSKAEKSSKRRIQFDEFDLQFNTLATLLKQPRRIYSAAHIPPRFFL